jgi:hypothetical protein
MNPRDRKLRLRKTTVRNLTQSRASQARGGVLEKWLAPIDSDGFFCTEADCPTYVPSFCATCDPFACASELVPTCLSCHCTETCETHCQTCPRDLCV